MQTRWRCAAGAIALAGIALVSSSGCAICEKSNRRTLNALDERIQPQSQEERIAWAPLAVPAASLAVAADALAVHPAHSIPAAWDDTMELYWRKKEPDLLRRTVFFLPCVALTPPTFLGSWALHSVFPMDND